MQSVSRLIDCGSHYCSEPWSGTATTIEQRLSSSLCTTLISFQDFSLNFPVQITSRTRVNDPPVTEGSILLNGRSEGLLSIWVGLVSRTSIPNCVNAISGLMGLFREFQKE